MAVSHDFDFEVKSRDSRGARLERALWLKSVLNFEGKGLSDMIVMTMLKFMVVLIVLAEQAYGGAIDSVDVCECEGVCVLRRWTRFVASDCHGGAVRTTGPGFLTWVASEVLEKFESVIIERLTLSCTGMPDVDGGLSPTTLIVDGVLCRDILTTTTTKMWPGKETKPRPPANPVDNDDDDDDDDDNNDDDDTQTTTTNGSSKTTTTVPTTTRMMTFVPLATFTASFRDWIVVISVGFLASATGVGIIVRVCIYYRRRRTASIQVNEVSSSEDEEQRQQRTYVLREVPRSPRRRGATDSMESVVLFAVDDSEL